MWGPEWPFRCSDSANWLNCDNVYCTLLVTLLQENSKQRCLYSVTGVVLGVLEVICIGNVIVNILLIIGDFIIIIIKINSNSSSDLINNMFITHILLSPIQHRQLTKDHDFGNICFLKKKIRNFFRHKIWVILLTKVWILLFGGFDWMSHHRKEGLTKSCHWSSPPLLSLSLSSSSSSSSSRPTGAARRKEGAGHTLPWLIVTGISIVFGILAILGQPRQSGSASPWYFISFLDTG